MITEMITEAVTLMKNSLTNYFSFSGVMSQRDYTIFTLTVLVLTFLVGVVAGMFGFIWLLLIFQLGMLTPVISSQIRRCRDIGISPWVCLLQLLVIGPVPLGSFILMVGGMVMKKGQVGGVLEEKDSSVQRAN